MNCHEVEQTLVAYINNEVGRSERELIRAHIATCQHCQNALASATELQERMSRVLHTSAGTVVPSGQAWTRLKAQLTQDPEPTFAQRVRRAISVPELGNAVVPRTILFVSTALIASFVLVTYAVRQPPTVINETSLPISGAPAVGAGVVVIPATQSRPRRISGPLEDSGELSRVMRESARTAQTQPRHTPPDEGVTGNVASPAGGEWLFVLGPADTASPSRACSGCAQPQ